MSFLTITLEVQLIGLNRGTFCHLRCPRKPLLATVPPHSEGHRHLQSPVLYLLKAHKCLRFTRTQEKLFVDSQFTHCSLQDLSLFFVILGGIYSAFFFWFPLALQPSLMYPYIMRQDTINQITESQTAYFQNKKLPSSLAKYSNWI